MVPGLLVGVLAESAMVLGRLLEMGHHLVALARLAHDSLRYQSSPWIASRAGAGPGPAPLLWAARNTQASNGV